MFVEIESALRNKSTSNIGIMTCPNKCLIEKCVDVWNVVTVEFIVLNKVWNH